MTTADGMQPTFSGRHTQLFMISDLYRVLTKFAKVHTDIARSILCPLDPFYLNMHLQ